MHVCWPAPEQPGVSSPPAGTSAHATRCATDMAPQHFRQLRSPSRVTMMQAANDRKLDDLAHVRGLDTSGVRGVLAERQMRPAQVIVLGDECSQQSSEMLLAEHDDVIEQLSPKRADHPLHKRRLPGRARCDQDFLDAKVLHPTAEACAVDAIAVP